MALVQRGPSSLRLRGDYGWPRVPKAAYFQHLRLPAAQLDDFSDSPVTLAELREYTRSRLLRPVVRLLQLLDAGSQGQDGQRLAQFPFLASAPAPFASAFSPLPPFLLYTAPWRAAAVIEVVGGRSAGFSGHQSEASCLFDWFEPEETSVSVMPPETLLLRWSIHRVRITVPRMERPETVRSDGGPAATFSCAHRHHHVSR